MDAWYEIISVYLTSAVKFLFAPFFAAMADFTFFETILVTSLGGVSGVVVFFTFGNRIIDFFAFFFKSTKTKKNAFTKKNKFYVKLIRNYGLFGLAVFSPILISIPVGSILAARFFHTHQKKALVYMSIGVILWSLSISIAIFKFGFSLSLISDLF